jgi:hypothetical protein
VGSFHASVVSESKPSRTLPGTENHRRPYDGDDGDEEESDGNDDGEDDDIEYDDLGVDFDVDVMLLMTLILRFI